MIVSKAKAPQIQHRTEVDKYIKGNPKYSQDRFEIGTESFFNKFRDGVQAFFDENGQEVFPNNE